MTRAPTDGDKVTTDSTEITWDPCSRVATVRYAQGASLVAKDGVDLIDSLAGWIGGAGEPFAVLADSKGLRATDGEYRAKASAFFRQYRDTAFIALIDPAPVITIVVEMFRIATGIQLKVFTSEASARFWLRTKGIAA